MSTAATGPGRPPKVVPKATASRKAELERLRELLWSRIGDGGDREVVGLANQLRAIAGELSSYEQEPPDRDELFLAELRARATARRAVMEPGADPAA